MTINCFVICDEQGVPFKYGLHEDITVHHNPEAVHLFSDQQDAEDVMANLNGLFVDGFVGAVRKAVLTVGEVVAESVTDGEDVDYEEDEEVVD